MTLSRTRERIKSAAAPTRLQISEIYLSVQGESTWAGLPCTFIRLTGCPLRCSYCDTEYAFYGGSKVALDDILAKVREYGCPLVEVTGGEPLAQPNCIPLLQALIDDNYTVLLETSGAYPISNVPRDVRKIVDLKCPSSGEMHRNLYENMELLAPHDEVKFVMGSREDYDWAKEQVSRYDLPQRCAAVLFSCVFGKLEPATLVEWMVADKLFNVRMQLQAHKFIWPPDTKGV
jgi:7-carboxy-7-deazaguanine synthase